MPWDRRLRPWLPPRFFASPLPFTSDAVAGNSGAKSPRRARRMGGRGGGRRVRRSGAPTWLRWSTLTSTSRISTAPLLMYPNSPSYSRLSFPSSICVFLLMEHSVLLWQLGHIRIRQHVNPLSSSFAVSVDHSICQIFTSEFFVSPLLSFFLFFIMG